MIVKQGNNWVVKDSSGKKILGTHNSKKKAEKQLAAIEISKTKKLEEFKNTFDNINNFMNEENYYKIKCAHLNQYKKELEQKLNILEALVSSGVGTEDNEQQEPSSFFGQNAPAAAEQGQQQQQQPVITKKKSKRGEEQEEPTQKLDINNPLQFAQAHMGIALTPQLAQSQVGVLSQYYDNPNTPEKEVPKDASWQNVNSAISNYMGSQVNKLIRQQRMA
jgi:hypothetical protein